MDLMWIAEGVGLVLLSLSSGVAGYFWRDSQDVDTVVERVRVERVDVPRIVEKEVVRVERIEVPVVVEKPTVKVERVEVPHLIEKVIEKAAPGPIARLFTPEPPAAPLVRVRLMDRHERAEHGITMIDAKLRRPSLMRDGRKYQCVKQTEQGEWVYRQVMH